MDYVLTVEHSDERIPTSNVMAPILVYHPVGNHMTAANEWKQGQLHDAQCIEICVGGLTKYTTLGPVGTIPPTLYTPGIQTQWKSYSDDAYLFAYPGALLQEWWSEMGQFGIPSNGLQQRL
ncbi:hypothetical protein BDQ17DRAFT_1339586 [Cyathus striatus]|nr:hypothetical protein BDQ17DRAFT_1339586 [Cyathus striatus]